MASKNNGIPKHELQALARVFADDIIAFFESKEGQKNMKNGYNRKKRMKK